MKRLQLLLLMLLALPIGMLAAGTSWQTATLIQDGQTVSGTMDKNSGDHWYRIEVPKDGAVTLDVKTDASLVMRYVELYAKSSDTDLGSWGYQYLYEVEQPFTVSGLKPGTYYVHLNRNEKEGSYTIKYTFTPNSYANDAEPNDKWTQTTKTLADGETAQGHLGYDYWNTKDNDDWYKIEVPADGAVTFDVKSDDKLIIRYVELHAKSSDTDLGSWGYQYLYEVEQPFTVSGLKPGTYYVHLNRNDSHGGYSIKYTFTPNPYQNDDEPNDDWTQATKTLTSGVTVQGHLGYDYWSTRDKDDWYMIEVPADGAVTFDVKSDDNLVIRYVWLHAKSSDTDLGSWGYQYLYEEEKPFTVSGLKPGTYYVHLNLNDSHGGYSIKYTFTPNPYQNDDEPNDDWTQATKTLTSDEIAEGHLGYDYWNTRDKDDWYMIEVPADGAVTFDVKSDDNLVIRYVWLHAKSSDTDLGSWGYQYLYEEEKPFTVSGLKPGTYYVRLNLNDSHGGYSIKYTFTPNPYQNDDEPNDGWTQATKTLTSGVTVQGHLGYDYWGTKDNDDWYKIEVPADGAVTFDVKSDDNLVIRYVELHAKSGDASLGSWGYQYLYEEEKPFTVSGVAPGTYYVHLNRNDSHGGYSLKYTFKRNRYPNDEEPNNEWKQAIPLEKGKTVSGHLGYDYWNTKDNDDWYKIDLPQAGKVEIHLSTDSETGLIVRYVELFKQNGNGLASVKSEYQYDMLRPVVAENLDAGTYYIRVNRNDSHGTYFLVWGADLSPVDPLPDEPDNPDDPDISGPDKDFIDDVGKDLLNQWDADSYRNVLGLLQQSTSYETQEISEWGSQALKSMKTAITTPYDGISNGYMLMIRAANFTGHFRAIDNRWKYEGPADDLQFIFTDKAGTQCVARAVSSGNTKTVNIPYEFDIDEDDDDEGIKKQAKELVKDVKLIAVEVPEHFEITFTHGSTQLMLTTVDFDLSCFTEDWSPTTHGLIFSINSTFAKSGASTRGGTGTFEISMDRVGYQPGTGIKSSFIAKNDGNQIISFNLEAPGTIKMEDGLIDINPETGVTIKDIGIESIKIDLDVMGRIQAHGSVSDVNTFVNTMINASNCKDEAEAQQIMSKLDGLIDGNFYYDNGTEAQGSLGLGLVYNEEKEEWKLEPTISFTSNNSTYPIKTYFSEKNFPEFVGGVQTILNELKEVATNLIQNVEKMNEEASGIENLPTDESSDAKAKIYTIGGRAVTSSSTLPSGVYIIKTPTGTRKFIKK